MTCKFFSCIIAWEAMEQCYIGIRSDKLSHKPVDQLKVIIFIFYFYVRMVFFENILNDFVLIQYSKSGEKITHGVISKKIKNLWKLGGNGSVLFDCKLKSKLNSMGKYPKPQKQDICRVSPLQVIDIPFLSSSPYSWVMNIYIYIYIKMDGARCGYLGLGNCKAILKKDGIVFLAKKPLSTHLLQWSTCPVTRALKVYICIFVLQ